MHSAWVMLCHRRVTVAPMPACACCTRAGPSTRAPRILKFKPLWCIRATVSLTHHACKQRLARSLLCSLVEVQPRDAACLACPAWLAAVAMAASAADDTGAPLVAAGAAVAVSLHRGAGALAAESLPSSSSSSTAGTCAGASSGMYTHLEHQQKPVTCMASAVIAAQTRAHVPFCLG